MIFYDLPMISQQQCKKNKNQKYLALQFPDYIFRSPYFPAICLSNQQIYDSNPLIFQLFNCVVDLTTNAFRRGRPSDLTSRRSLIVVDEKWLKDPKRIAPESEDKRQKAWNIIWTIFRREGHQHALDHAEILGDQDESNFLYFMQLHARLLEGKPLARCILLHSPRGRNSKGLI